MARAAESTAIIQPVLTSVEAYAVFDRQVRRLMDGMSGEGFARRWQTGSFEPRCRREVHENANRGCRHSGIATN